MQAGKSTVQAAKEAVANVGASAWAGMEKTKAVVHEKMDKMAAQDEAEKAAAELKKGGRIHEVEVEKQEAMSRNAAVKERATAPTTHQPSQGLPGVVAGDLPAGGHPEPGIVEIRPRNQHAGGDYPQAHGAVGRYS